jgi:predicted acylesterase/phospholipase RssA
MLTVTRQDLVASAAVTADRPRSHPGRPLSYDKKVGLVLQGGGALGCYQAGVYEALASSEYLPDWVAGISIGAINAAIIAGNPPENRLKYLRIFWNEITAPTSLWPCALDSSLGIWQQKMGALTALMFGRPGLFTPRTWLDCADCADCLRCADIGWMRLSALRLPRLFSRAAVS